jgi:hypothetical protein
MKRQFIAPHSSVQSNDLSKSINSKCGPPKKGFTRFVSKRGLSLYDTDIAAERKQNPEVKAYRLAMKTCQKISAERHSFEVKETDDGFVFQGANGPLLIDKSLMAKMQ